jgi:hypothetical protein
MWVLRCAGGSRPCTHVRRQAEKSDRRQGVNDGSLAHCENQRALTVGQGANAKEMARSHTVRTNELSRWAGFTAATVAANN